ncbi:MAG: hypothetical protein UY09_C0042G0001 [Parcubacteria group bacterium GW2011_GWA2_47_8]|nr:MAG: hypothetical protein UY09_C0042G0001 [Parcubacteria group bacterium GW2011_GWA2_47_8]
MDSKYLLDLYSKLESMGIKIWIDGGWAVDALLGKQTRPHEDLDIAIERNKLLELRSYLIAHGYRDVEREKNKMWDLVMNDGNGHEIEVHTFDLDDNGMVLKEDYWDGYSVDSLNGVGYIEGYKVRCVSVEQLIKTHRNDRRELKEKDYKDIRALCDKFKIEYPEGLRI